MHQLKPQRFGLSVFLLFGMAATLVAQSPTPAKTMFSLENTGKQSISTWLIDSIDRQVDQRRTVPPGESTSFQKFLPSDRLVVEGRQARLSRTVGQPPHNLEFDGVTLSTANPRTVSAKPASIPRLGFESMFTPSDNTMTIKSVKSGGLGEKMGLRIGDIITKMNGNKLTSPKSYEEHLVKAFNNDGKITLSVKINGIDRSVPMTTWLY